jgi:triacylglycerol lipase
MPAALTPTYAARLALGAYTIGNVNTRIAFLAEYKDDMEIAQAKMVSAVTGGYILKKQHLMAVFSAGKGAFKDQAFAIFMGTNDLYDTLTDLNTGIGISSTGNQVHQGFNRAFESLRIEFEKFIIELKAKGVTTLHCVGHSLGGAIATLSADWVRAGSHLAQTCVYTFGSPRVGMSMFAAKCTQRVLATNIYRAYHKTDPVPMLPTWPFFHVPDAGVDYLINSPVTAVPWEYHFMRHYIESAEAVPTWAQLHGARPASYMKSAIEAWLQSDGIEQITASSLGLLEAALIYVLEKTANAAGILAVSSFSSSFTLLDRMAMMLAKAAQISAEVSVWVYHLVKKMGALIGVVVKKGADLTTEFIRTVFLQLHQRIADMVRSISRQI